MKAKRMMLDADEYAAKAVFSRYDENRSLYISRLRYALRENGFTIQGFDWDEHEGTFYWHETDSIESDALREEFAFLTLRTNYCVNPKRPVADEIARCLRQRDAVNKMRLKIGRAAYVTLGEEAAYVTLSEEKIS